MNWKLVLAIILFIVALAFWIIDKLCDKFIGEDKLPRWVFFLGDISDRIIGICIGIALAWIVFK